MKKLKLFFACLLMAVLSIGQVWAAEQVAYTLEVASTGGNSSPHNSYTAAATTTISGIEWSVLGNSNQSPWRLGGKESNCSGVDRDVHSNTAISDNISKIEITHGTASNITVNSMTVIVSKNSDFSSPVSTLTPEFVASDVVTVTRPEGKDWSNCYFKFVYNLSVSGNSNKFVQFSGAVFYKETGGTPTCAKPTFSPAAGAVVSGTTVALSTTTAEADIYYTIGADPVDPTSASTKYTAPITITEATTIKAITIKEGSNDSEVATASYTIATPLTTMQDIFEAATTTETAKAITFNSAWVVSGVKSDGKQAYLTDGTKGLILYSSSDMGLAVGNTLSGTKECTLVLYNGAAELKNFNTSGLTKGTDGVVTPVVLDAEGIAALTGVNTGSLIKISGECTYVSSKYYIAGVQLYNQLYSFSVSAETNYECTGVYVQYNTTKEICPRSAADIVAQTSVANPTFSPAAGEYTEVQNVTLSCATDGATVYYTKDGTNPTNESTVYSSAIEVGASMTIKAIAYKGEDHSEVVSAAYTINLPVDPETTCTWDLSIDETATASEDALTWTATYVDMSFAKGTSTTNANNYYPGTSGQSYTSTRTYKNSVITITPNGKEITSIVFTATTQGYGTALKNSTWSNASATAASDVVTVTPENGTQAISATIGATCGFTAVCVHYKNPDATKPADPTFSPVAGEYTEVQNVTLSCATDGATVYYTTDGTNPTNESTVYSSAIEVGASMTIKAIAIKDDKQSNVVSAAYTINLPVSEEDQKTWDLSIDETATASADALTWTATYVDMSVTSGTAAANNYYPGTSGKSYTSTRFYNGATLTITPNGKQITSIVIETDGATPFKNATWTNGTATNVDKIVTITVTSPGAVTAVFQANATAFSVQVNYTAIDPTFPVAPTFSVEGGTYTSAQSVELSCETVGATIYYTTDGTAPSSTSTEYTSAIPVNEDMTIKAVAINGEKVGPIVTQVYKINLPLSTMQAIFDAAPSTATSKSIAFSEAWVVSGVSSDGHTAYLTDGTKGLILYNSSADMELAVGNTLSGTKECTLVRYKGAAELKDFTKESLTVGTEGTVSPASIAPADLTGVNTGALISLTNWKYDGTNLTDGTTSIQPFNTLYPYGEVFEENKYYNVGGIYLQYDAKKEILPRNADDIKEVSLSDPEISYTPAAATIELGQSLPGTIFANPHELAISYSSNNEAVATVSDGGLIQLAGGLGTAVITAHTNGNATYGAGNATYTITVNAPAPTPTGTTYRKVTATADITDGEYLIVYETSSVAFDGSLETLDAVGNTVDVTINEGVIAGTAAIDAAVFTIDVTAGSIKSASNKYIGVSSYSNGLSTSDNAAEFENALSIDADGNAVIVITTTGGDMKLRYNSASNQLRFRYYKNDGQQAIQLYKKETPKYSVTYAAGEGSGDAPAAVEYEEGETFTVAAADLFTAPADKEFDKWNDGTNDYAPGDTYTVGTADVVLTAIWKDAAPEPTYETVRTGLDINRFYTVCLPKKVIAIKGASFWTLNNKSQDGATAYLEEETNNLPFAAGKPFIIQATADKLEVVYEGEATETPGVNGAIHGTLTYMDAAALAAAGSDVYMLFSNELRPVGENNHLDANRAYVKVGELNSVSSVPQGAPGKRVVAMPMQKDQAQGFENLDASEKPMKVMIEGTLYILRGEKVYDATGRLVK